MTTMTSALAAEAVEAHSVNVPAVPARTVSARAVPAHTVPAQPRPSGPPAAALKLLRAARRGLTDAAGERVPANRYVGAHLAALRAAAAILATRGEPRGATRRRPRSVWDMLPQVEPALAEWAAFFAASAVKRAAAEAGLPRAVSAAEADRLLHDADTFVTIAERALGRAGEPMLPLLGEL